MSHSYLPCLLQLYSYTNTFFGVTFLSALLTSALFLHQYLLWCHILICLLYFSFILYSNTFFDVTFLSALLTSALFLHQYLLWCHIICLVYFSFILYTNNFFDVTFLSALFTSALFFTPVLSLVSHSYLPCLLQLYSLHQYLLWCHILICLVYFSFILYTNTFFGVTFLSALFTSVSFVCSFIFLHFFLIFYFSLMLLDIICLNKTLHPNKGWRIFATPWLNKILQLTARSRSLLEKLRVPQPAKKFHCVFWIRNYITVFTTARRFFLSCINHVKTTVQFAGPMPYLLLCSFIRC